MAVFLLSNLVILSKFVQLFFSSSLPWLSLLSNSSLSLKLDYVDNILLAMSQIKIAAFTRKIMFELLEKFPNIYRENPECTELLICSLLAALHNYFNIHIWKYKK